MYSLWFDEDSCYIRLNYNFHKHSHPLKKFAGYFGIFLLIMAAVVYFNQAKLAIISGYAAKNMASTLAFTGRDAASVAEEDLDIPMIRWADAEQKKENRVRADVFGLAEREALCRDGLGCVLVPPGAGDPPTLPKFERSFSQDSLPYPYGQGEPADTLMPGVSMDQVNRALDKAFSDPDVQRTRTVLILYKGQLIGERYAKGFGPDTPILGWSMTKSILATLYGIMQYEGHVQVTERVPIPSWQQDERQAITYEHLLRMNSSLAWEEDYTGISDVTRMLFQAKDMSKAQAKNPLVGAPGEVWKYSSGSTNVLAGALYQLLPDTLSYLEYPYRKLAEPLGMHTLLLETDWVGNFVGSSYGWASTRDWGRFGQLYLNNGQWHGTQLFDERWVNFVTSPTPGSNGEYGAHFWLNRGGTYPSAPEDLYSANGYLGQHVFIIPSKDLVVVRTGLAEAPDFKADAFLKAILKALP